MLSCATRTILDNKNRSSALVSSRKVKFFLRILLKRTNTFKIAHLDEMSAGMVMHGKRGKCSQCLVRVTQPSQRVIKIMPAENKNSLNILNLYFRYT